MVFVTLVLFFGGLLLLMSAITGKTIADEFNSLIKGKP